MPIVSINAVSKREDVPTLIAGTAALTIRQRNPAGEEGTGTLPRLPPSSREVQTKKREPTGERWIVVE